MEQRLRRAVLDKLEGLGETADYIEPDQLASLARSEIRRLTDGWRNLLVTHQPDDNGRCPQCSGWIKRRRWPCPVWLAAHQHLIGEGLGHRDRRYPLRNPFTRCKQMVVIRRRLEREAGGTDPLGATDGPHGRVWRIPKQQSSPAIATTAGGRLETSSERIYRAAVVEPTSKARAS